MTLQFNVKVDHKLLLDLYVWNVDIKLHISFQGGKGWKLCRVGKVWSWGRGRCKAWWRWSEQRVGWIQHPSFEDWKLCLVGKVWQWGRGCCKARWRWSEQRVGQIQHPSFNKVRGKKQSLLPSAKPLAKVNCKIRKANNNGPKVLSCCEFHQIICHPINKCAVQWIQELINQEVFTLKNED